MSYPAAQVISHCQYPSGGDEKSVLSHPINVTWLCHRWPWAEAQAAFNPAVPKNISNIPSMKYEGESPADWRHSTADCQLLKHGVVPQHLAISAWPTQHSQSLTYCHQELHNQLRRGSVCVSASPSKCWVLLRRVSASSLNKRLYSEL